MSNAINVLQQFSTLSGILAGFSFAAIIQLVSIKEKSRLLGASIATFLVATIGFLFVVFSFVFVSLTMSPHVNDPSAPSITSAVTLVVSPVFITFLIGILFLMAGISLAAWMHSKLMGVIS